MDNVLRIYKQYHPDPDEELLTKCYSYAQLAYHGEVRKNGEPILAAALKIAERAANFNMDTHTIGAALLYYTPYFGLNARDIAVEIDPKIGHLIECIDNLRELSLKQKLDVENVEKADYLRRVILTIGKDLRAVFLRLMEKLYSLTSLEALAEDQRTKSIRQVLALYAPLADMIGLSQVKMELEDTAFEAQSPEDYNFILANIMEHPFASSENIKLFTHELESILRSNAVAYQNVFGRTKRIYTTHKKALRYQKKYNLDYLGALERIYDKVAFTIILEDIPTCYAVAGILNKSFSVKPEHFDDYITFPKPNGYRSLQSTIEVEPGHMMEIQLRTQEMHDFNEYGPAGHVFYKLYGADKTNITDAKVKMLRRLLGWREELIADIANAKTRLTELEDTIFVFTPKGDVIELPRGATPVDFAYAVHTDIGNSAIGAKVDGVQKPLDYVLSNGTMVEITTSPSRKGPSRDWLKFVRTKDAKIHIKRHIFRSLKEKDLRS